MKGSLEVESMKHRQEDVHTDSLGSLRVVLLGPVNHISHESMQLGMANVLFCIPPSARAGRKSSQC